MIHVIRLETHEIRQAIVEVDQDPGCACGTFHEDGECVLDLEVP